MAGETNNVKAKKSHGNSGNQLKNKGPTSPILGQKHKLLAELHGVASMAIQTPEFDKPLSHVSSLKELQHQFREKAQLLDCYQS